MVKLRKKEVAMNLNLFLTDIPKSVNITPLEFGTFNMVIISAISDFYNTGNCDGKISQLARINQAEIKNLWGREFCARTYKHLENFNAAIQKAPQIRKNVYDFLYFMQTAGSQLRTLLKYENKILNYPLILENILKPSYDFANSDLVVFLSNKVDKLKKMYDNSQKSDDLQQ